MTSLSPKKIAAILAAVQYASEATLPVGCGLTAPAPRPSDAPRAWALVGRRECAQEHVLWQRRRSRAR
ncbi:MAG: hypothetical protein HY900_34885 [Deltaproteobacteria bacterium]|nr:hypothetical protein [Deltaproteobacteria bacterium]